MSSFPRKRESSLLNWLGSRFRGNDIITLVQRFNRSVSNLVHGFFDAYFELNVRYRTSAANQLR
jgi:hypothetical protein